MLIIGGKRGEGKSSCLVYYSSMTNIPIVYDTTKQLELIRERAAANCLDIPSPIHYSEVDDKIPFLVDEMALWYQAHKDFVTLHNDQVAGCTVTTDSTGEIKI